MINWVSDIFVSASDQARLVTTLIATGVAIFVVLINQRFNSERSRKDKLIEKIEEMYKVNIKLHDLKNRLHAHRLYTFTMPGEERTTEESSGLREDIENMHLEFLESQSTAVLLSGLYFNDLQNDVNHIGDHYQTIYGQYITTQDVREYVEIYKRINRQIEINLLNINTKLLAVMKNTMH